MFIFQLCCETTYFILAEFIIPEKKHRFEISPKISNFGILVYFEILSDGQEDDFKWVCYDTQNSNTIEN